MSPILAPIDPVVWRARRLTGIGASESAAVLGISPFATALDVYLSKVGEAPEREPTTAMRIGLALEPALATLYSEETGRDVVAGQLFLRSGEHPHLFATLDGMADDGRIVEFKTANGWYAQDWTDADDGIPGHYLIQVHHQMIVAGKDCCDVAVLIGGSKFRVYTIARVPMLAEAMLPTLAAFWDRVQKLIPPDPTFRDLETLARVAPTAADAIDLDDEDAFIELHRYIDLGREAREVERRREEAKLRLLMAMKGHARAVFPDGHEITRKEITRKEKPRPARTTSYYDFRVRTPKEGDE